MTCGMSSLDSLKMSSCVMRSTGVDLNVTGGGGGGGREGRQPISSATMSPVG